jgi:hypothetical protein
VRLAWRRASQLDGVHLVEVEDHCSEVAREADVAGGLDELAGAGALKTSRSMRLHR